MAYSTVPDFSDTRTIVIAATDPRNITMCANDHFGHNQACDGPTFVVVGAEVSDQRLRDNLPYLAERFGVTMEQLIGARDQAIADGMASATIAD